MLLNKNNLENALLNDAKPSEFFEKLRFNDDFKVIYPELFSLIGLHQNPKFHAEGDVWNHTMLVIDAAVSFREKVSFPLGFMLSALVHDFGKAVCTEEINGVIHSYDHESKGLPLIEDFLKRLHYSDDTIKYVLNMALLHMKPNTIAVNNSSIKASNRMFNESIAPLDLIYLGAADCLGQIPVGNAEKNIAFLKERLEIYNKIMSRPYVTAEDLQAAGYIDSEILSETMEYADKLRLSNVPIESAQKQCIAYARSLKKNLEKSLH